jgi:cytosol alanyl aminopeptidase
MRRLAFAALLVWSFGTSAATVRLGSDVVPVSQAIELRLDPRRDDYEGSTLITLDVRKGTRTFALHAVDLDIRAMRLTRDDRPFDATRTAGEDGTLVIRTGESLTPGRYELELDFSARFNRQAVGLYKMVAKDEPYLFTQFQAIDARRAYPTFDEPRLKARFQVTVTIPAIYDAVSNTPVESETTEGGSKTMRFAETKLLPSYLVALAVGKFDYTPIAGLGVPGRVVAPKGMGHLAGTAAEITPPVLAALEKYFNAKYPFEKVDLIAVPEYWAGAMENPGAITYRDTVLLLDPATASPWQRQSLIRITAHELAHMWFGDLVTMEWWDDFWLNESFADWLGDKITDQVHPELDHLIGEMGGIQNVMDADMRSTAEPIRRGDISPEEALNNVGLAYNKGKAVLGMFESWIGPERFREGVLAHIEANAWGNATAEEFFSSLGKHAPTGTTKALETFITTPGIPLVTATLDGTLVTLTQKRFSAGAIPGATWRVPVVLRYSDGTTTHTKGVLLDKPSTTVKLNGTAIAWLHPNADAAGYYRWQLDPASMSALAARAPDVLSTRERVAFIGNLGALFRAGALPGDAYLDHLSRFSRDVDPHVVSAVAASLDLIQDTFDSPELRPAFAAYVRRTLGPALDRVGFVPVAGEPQAVSGLRSDLIWWLGAAGEDEHVWTFVREQLPKYLADPSSLHPTLASNVVGLAARKGDEAMFHDFFRRFESATLPAARSRFLTALGQFRDPALQAKRRELVLNPSVRPTELAGILGASETEEEREAVYQWITANYDAVMKRVPPTFGAAMPFIASGCSLDRVARAREFFASRKVEGTERRLASVESQVRSCVTLREREMAAVRGFLERAD